MDGRIEVLQEKLDRLLKEAAAASVELDRVSGRIQGVPHYSVIELRAHELGQRLSREIQQQQMQEVTADQTFKGECACCGRRADLVPIKRKVVSIDGPLELQELEGYCTRCRRAFFPSARTDGL
jgi:hypothetical protein